MIAHSDPNDAARLADDCATTFLRLLTLGANIFHTPGALGWHFPAVPGADFPVKEQAKWRSSKLIGVNVYNDQNEKLGDI